MGVPCPEQAAMPPLALLLAMDSQTIMSSGALRGRLYPRTRLGSQHRTDAGTRRPISDEARLACWETLLHKAV
jgi:hypothetical protein